MERAERREKADVESSTAQFLSRFLSLSSLSPLNYSLSPLNNSALPCADATETVHTATSASTQNFLKAMALDSLQRRKKETNEREKVKG